MKKIGKWILGLFVVISLSACGSSKKEDVFWKETINVLEDKLENNSYVKGHWNIGVEGKNVAKDKKHRNITIRQVYKNATTPKTILFAFQNRDNTNHISYIYKKSEIKEENESQYTVDITSTDKTYKKYDIKYTKQIFKSGNFQNQEEAVGYINIGDDHKLTYENVPLLGEAMKAFYNEINDFQKEFEIDYKKLDFINLPELAKDTEFIVLEKEQAYPSATTTNYYAQPHINAKGYSLVTFLKIDKDMKAAQYGRYCVEQKAYEFNQEVKLEKRGMEHCYNLVQNDPDVSYAVYVQGDRAYLYLQSMSDQEIASDEARTNAKMELKTSNTSYEDLMTIMQ